MFRCTGKIFQRVAKLCFTCPQERFEEKSSSFLKYGILSFSDNVKKFGLLLSESENLHSAWKIGGKFFVFQASIRYSWGKTHFSIDKFSTVLENEKNIRLAPEILLGTLSKLHSPARHFVYSFFLLSTEVIFLKFFQYLSEQKIFRPSDPKFRLFSKIAFYLSIKIFVEKLFFWKNFMNFYLFWTLKEKPAYCRFFWLFCQLCILCDPRDCLEK